MCAHRGGQLAALRRKVRCHNGFDATRSKGRDDGDADRAATEHQGRLTGSMFDLLTACNPTAMGSVSAACLRSRPLGMGSSSGAESSIRSA